MLKVLLVDDEPIFRMGLRTSVAWEEMECRIVGEARNGEEALIQIEEKSPDLVFLDIKMPKMDGIEVLKKAKNIKARPQFIVLSCFNEYEFVREAMKLGACDYLFKPLMEGKDIAAAVQEVRKKTDEHMETGETEKHAQVSVTLENILLEQEELGVSLERLEQLCPELEDTAYFVMAVRIPGKQFRERKKEALLKLCRGILLRDFDDGFLPYFAEYEGVLYGLFWEEMEEERRTSSRGHILWKKIKEYVETPVWLGSSRLKRGAKEIKKAYDEAKWAMQVHYFSCFSRKNNEYIEYERQADKNYEFEEIYKEQLDKIRLMFGKYDIEGIKNEIHLICESVLVHEYFNVKDFSYLLANIVINNMRYYKSGAFLEQLVVEDYDVISNIYHQETMEDACGYLIELLRRVFGLMRAPVSSETHTDTIRKIEEYLKEHYAEKIALQDMANMAHLSLKYFCKLFKQVTGETFVNYLTEIRIREAEKLLERTNLKTYEVAEKTGFSDYRHFCKTFKKVTGKTPTDTRKRNV